ncbi:MAG: hypothetical protein R3E86_05295 [Pseudomonadales bacterium]
MKPSRLAGLIVLLTLPGLAAHSRAASIESLVMPGPVIEGHAETEHECSACHAPFSQSRQSDLCLTCHEDIADDISAARGLHGLHAKADDASCRGCHTEHKGRDADITGLVIEAFDHHRTGFDLEGAHAEASCSDCHAQGEKFRAAEPACASCHQKDDAHKGNLGEDCGSCHDASSWQQAQFDHGAETDWPLNGAHEPLACAACHTDQVYENTPTECVACHAPDDVHDGQRGEDCGSCHNERDWKESEFDHAAETGFALEGAHADLACAGCHLADMSLEEPPDTCVGCHSADDPHQGRRGTDCAACHRQDTWDVAFDHLAETGFALVGEHADLACQACHLGALDDPLPSECEDCHAQDDPHEQQLSVCSDCHDPSGWSTSVRFDHEFTHFPLLGMHRLATCEQCHTTLAFLDAGETCNSCHAADDVHRGSMGDDCAQCHGPSGWSLWQFDHDVQTDFPLTGAHEDLACEGCHVPGTPRPLEISQRCVSCHQGDDVHAGQFGDRCEQCHTTTAFSDAEALR